MSKANDIRDGMVQALQQKLEQAQVSVHSLQLQLQMDRETYAATVAELNGRLATARVEYKKLKEAQPITNVSVSVATNELRTKLADAEKRATKFKSDFEEATKWCGVWKNKCQRLQRGIDVPINNGGHNGTFAERKAAAQAQARRTGQMARA